MNDAQLFAFEADFVASLRCIPMAVRLKLDRSGVKLTLRQWSRFTLDDRRRLLEAPCRTEAQIAAYHDELVRLVAQRANEVARPLADPPAPIWEETAEAPPAVAAYARSMGAAPVQPHQCGHGSGEHQTASGSHRAGPEREFFLVLPDDLAGLRVHGAQRANVVVKQALDAETLAEVGGAGLVSQLLGPVIHRPVVGRNVEQFGLLAVAHRHPVGTAKERRRNEDRLALVRPLLRLRRVLAIDDHWLAGLQVETLGPGNALDKRPGADQ